MRFDEKSVDCANNPLRGRRAFLAGALLPVLAGCRSTPQFVDAAGRPLEGSLAAMERVVINGVEQSVWLRGRSVRNPILLILHGGPGASESALLRHFNTDLEQDYLVCYWEQRGTGRSWRPQLDAASMSIAQILDDLDRLVDLLLRRFGEDKVVLLGHSWGTVLGVLYSQRHPAKVARYIGVAQVVNVVAAQEAELAFALEQARQRRDDRAITALAGLGNPPFGVDAALELEGWTARFGGLFAGGLDKGDLIMAALRASEANLLDLALFGLGNRFSLRALWREYLQVALDKTVPRLGVPVLLVLGRHDRHVSSELAARWFASLQAPGKRLVWFEQSGHNPPFEEPARFNALLREVARHGAG